MIEIITAPIPIFTLLDGPEFCPLLVIDLAPL